MIVLVAYLMFWAMPEARREVVIDCATSLVHQVVPLAYLPETELEFPVRAPSRFDRQLWQRHGGFNESGSFELRDAEGRLLAFALVHETTVNMLDHDALMNALGRLYVRAKLRGQLPRAALLVVRHTHNYWHYSAFSLADKRLSLILKAMFDYIQHSQGPPVAVEMQLVSRPIPILTTDPVPPLDLPYGLKLDGTSWLLKSTFRIPPILGPLSQRMLSKLTGGRTLGAKDIVLPGVTHLTADSPEVAYDPEELSMIESLEEVIRP